MINKKTKKTCVKCKISYPDPNRFVYLEIPERGGGGDYCLDCASTLLIEMRAVDLLSGGEK